MIPLFNKNRALLLALSWALLWFSMPVRAATWNWTGTSSSNWNTAANWSPASVPASNTATILNFTTFPSGTSNNNIGGTFTLNQLNFNASGPFTLTGNTIRFSGVAPSLTYDNSSTALSTISNNIQLRQDTTIFGSSANSLLSLSGVIANSAGAHSLTVAQTGTGTVRFDNATNSFTGGLFINSNVQVTQGASFTVAATGNSYLGAGAVSVGGAIGNLDVSATGAASNLTFNRNLTLANTTSGYVSAVLSAGNNLILSSGTTINLSNANEIQLAPNQTSGTGGGTYNGAIFNIAATGGTVNFTGQLGGLLTDSNFTVNTVATGTGTSAGAAIVKYSSMDAGNGWLAGGRDIDLQVVTGTGNLTLWMTNGAATQLRQTGYGGLNQMGFAGVVGGDVTADSLSTNIGRFSATSGATYTLPSAQGLFFYNVLQLTGQDQGSTAATTLSGNMTVTSGASVGFQGTARTVGTIGAFNIGASSANTLTIQNGGIANMDIGYRNDSAATFIGQMNLQASTIINAGGRLNFTQSRNVGGTTYSTINVTGNITGQGTSSTESVLNFDNTVGGVVSAVAGTARQIVVDPSVNLFVQGSGTGGLRVQGTKANVDGILTSARLQSRVLSVGVPVTDQGTLTIAYSDNGARTFTASDGPAAASWIKLGFDSEGGSSPVYTLNNSTGSGGSLANWNGLVVKNNATVIMGSNISFTGAGTTTFALLGGTLQLANGGSPFSATFEGDGDLQSGTINGGASGGTLILGGNANKTTAGVVVLNGNIQALGSSGINIQAGTLSQSASNLISNTTRMTLSGGVWATNGNSEVLSTLTLAANSTIDLGTGSSIINFANSSAVAWTGGTQLQLTNWSGNATGGGTDQVYFGSTAAGLTAAQLSQIVFINPTGFAPGTYSARILSTGEVVPNIPEPSTVAMGIGLAALAAGFEWRRRRQKVSAPLVVSKED